MKNAVNFRSKLQTKLITVVVTVFASALVAGTGILIYSIDRLGKASIQRQVDEERAIIEQRLTEFYTELMQAAVFLTHQSVILDGVAQTGSRVIRQHLQLTALSLSHDLIWITDTEGEIIGSYPEGDALKDVGSLFGDRLTVTEPTTEFALYSGVPLIAARVPILSGNQRVIGQAVVADVIDSDLLGQLNFGRDSLALVVFVNDSAAKGVSASEADGNPHLTVDQVEDLRLNPTDWRQLLGQDSIRLSDVVVKGTPHVIHYQLLSLGTQVVGYYVIAIDEDVPRTIQNNVLMISMASLVAVLIATAFLITGSVHRLVLRPLDTLNRAANQFGGGQLATRVTPENRDEIGLLYATFNAMASSVENRTNELSILNSVLEARVCERTIELERQSLWLETVVCEAKESIIVTDSQGKIRLANDAALVALDKSESDLFGVSLPEIMSQVTENPFKLRGSSEIRGELPIGNRFYLYSVTPIK